MNIACNPQVLLPIFGAAEIRPPTQGMTALARATRVGKAKPALQPAPAAQTPLAVSSLKLIVDTLDDAKAEDIATIDLAGISPLADAMVVATGRSDRHVTSIADRVSKALKDAGQPVPKVEGNALGEWVLLDAGDVIVHIFKPEARSFYNIEKLWGADRPRDARA